MHATSSKILTLRKLIALRGHLFTDCKVTLLDGNAKLIACSVQCGKYHGTLENGSGIRLAAEELVCVSEDLSVL